MFVACFSPKLMIMIMQYEKNDQTQYFEAQANQEQYSWYGAWDKYCTKSVLFIGVQVMKRTQKILQSKVSFEPCLGLTLFLPACVTW